MEPASDIDIGSDIVVLDLIDDEVGVVTEKCEEFFHESSSDAVVLSAAAVNGVTVRADLLESVTGTVAMELSSDIRESGDIVIQDSIDDVRVSVDERTIVMENIEKVLDESSSDDVVLSVPPGNSDIAVSNLVAVGADSLDSKTGTLTVQPFSDNDSVNDARVFEDVKEIVMEKADEVLDELSSETVVLSVPLSNIDIPASNEVKIGDGLFNLKCETVMMEADSDHNGDGDNVVQGSVDDTRVSVDEREIVLESNEKGFDEFSSDALVTSVQLCNSDIAASDVVETDLLDSETGTLIMEPCFDCEVSGDVAVQIPADDVRVSVDEEEIVIENIGKVGDELSSDTVVLSATPGNNDIPASNKVKVGADLLDLKTRTLTMEPSSDHIEGGGMIVHDSVNDARVSTNKKEIITENVEKVLDKNVVKDEEKEGQYKVTDLVWAKVRNYPWWPGQIFDSSASTDKAKKYSNKKGFLVAYFGDQTFAWNKASNIKPFRKNFHKMEKQGKSKAFYHAVNCALDEVLRRTDFGLACSCLSKEVYNNIKSQVFVNAGIKKEASEIEGGDDFSTVSTFKPMNIIQSVQDLAREHFDGIGRLEVLSVRTQLLAFFRWKGYNQFSVQFFDGLDDKFHDNSGLPLMEEDKVVGDAKLASVSAKDSSMKRKRKLNAFDSGDLVLDDKLKDDSELPLMEEDKVVENGKQASVSAKVSSKKKKLNACDSGDSVPIKKERCLKKVTPKGKSTVKSKSKKNSGDSGDSVLDDKLEDDSQHPLMEEDKVIEDVKTASVSAKISSKKKNSSASDSGDLVPRKKEKCLKNETRKENSSVKSKSKKVKTVTAESSGFKKESRNATDDKNLSNSPPKKLFRIGDTICRIAKQLSESPSILKKESKKSKNDEKSVEKTDPSSILKKKSKKSKIDEKCVEQTESPSILKKESKKSKNGEKCVEQTESPLILKAESKKSKNDEKYVEQSKENSKTSIENSATALILNFTNLDSIPSVTKLNEIFRRYGTVKETDTEILQKNNCAKVVFGEQSNAETAFSSAGKLSIFGPSLISYRLDYSPTLRKIYTRNRKRNRKDMKSGETNQSEDETA